MSRQYPTTQRWALALHRWFPNADGIRYLSRHASENRNYCLFLERCVDKLRAEELGNIAAMRESVLQAADEYHLEIHWNS